MAIAALTRLTIANTIRQPVTWLMTVLSLLLIGLSCVFGMFNFGSEDSMRLLSTSGVAIHVLHGLFLSVVLSSAAIHDELSSRTALTLFAKPVSRSGFLIGKLLGVLITVLITSSLIFIAHLTALYFLQDDTPTKVPGYEEEGVLWGRIVLGHLLAACNALIFCSISSVLALRLHLIVNIVLSFGLFLLGHLLGALQWTGAFIVPALNLFNIDSSLQFAYLDLSAGYVLGSVGYALIFCTGCVCLGLALIKAQDIP